MGGIHPASFGIVRQEDSQKKFCFRCRLAGEAGEEYFQVESARFLLCFQTEHHFLID